SRNEENVQSWVDSSNFPAEAVEVGEVVIGGSVEEGDEKDIGDMLPCQHQGHGELLHGDGDMTLANEGKCQPQLCVSAIFLEADKGN
ncbi:hypothetical protein A2U01_0084345, partial [Trifolium medium]|nr:hypothetical protein [Trifolium medium]